MIINKKNEFLYFCGLEKLIPFHNKDYFGTSNLIKYGIYGILRYLIF